MPTPIDRHEVQRLLSYEDAQVVEVLPEAEFEDEHLPGAINIPLNRARPRARPPARAPGYPREGRRRRGGGAMTLGPSTIRPSSRLQAMVERMQRQKLTNLPATTSDGRLIVC